MSSAFGGRRRTSSGLRKEESSARPANRPLQTPKMRYIPKLSLPKLMAHYAAPRKKLVDGDGMGIVPGGNTSAEGFQRTRNKKKNGTNKFMPTFFDSPSSLASNSNPSFAVSAQVSLPPAEGAPPRSPERIDERSPCSASRSRTASATDELGWPAVGGGLSGLKKAQNLFATKAQISEQSNTIAIMSAAQRLLQSMPGQGDFDDDDEDTEFMRRRNHHPRLRWPRLANHGEAPSGLASMAATADGFGSAVRELGDAYNTDSSATLSSAASPSISTRIKLQAVRPAILPRVRCQHPVRPGTTSTLHVPIGDEQTNSMGDTAQMSSSSSSCWIGTTLSGDSPSSSSQMRLDRKWFQRMTPISCLPSEPSLQVARKAVAMRNGMIGNAAGEYVNIQGWGVNDDYLDALLASHCLTESNCGGIQFMNLSENQITSTGVLKIKGYGIPDTLRSLNLASNRLAELGGLATVELVQVCPKLVDLDLSGNVLGDVAIEDLCGALERCCRGLAGLGLARCQLGATPRAGAALGSLVSTAPHLKSLDLHWNALHGIGAHTFLQGLFDNGTALLKLSELTLSWNRIGSGQNADASRKQMAVKNAKQLCGIFSDATVLFHLDISYNCFDSEECEILSQGLRLNHTLFGLHLVGNDCSIDDMGFVIPSDRKPDRTQPATLANFGSLVMTSEFIDSILVNASQDKSKEELPLLFKAPPIGEEEQQVQMNKCVSGVPSRFRFEHPADLDPPNKEQQALSSFLNGSDVTQLRHNPSLQSLTGDGQMSFTDTDLQAEQQWVHNRSRVQPLGQGLANHTEALQRNSKCCWICENWVEHKVTWTPGISGPERADEVQSCLVLYKIDGFTRPIKMTRQEVTSNDVPRCRPALTTGRTLDALSRPPLIASRASLIRPRDSLADEAQKNGESGLTDESTAKDVARQRIARRSVRQSRLSQLSSTGGGKAAVTWVGLRMLPPSTEYMQVVFVVNGQVTVADDIMQKRLRVPKTICVNSSNGQSNPIAISEVNLVSPSLSHDQAIRSGQARSVVELQDPEARDEFTVRPRKLLEVAIQAKAKEVWTFETSTFKEFTHDNDGACQKCFEVDWQHSRLNQIVKDQKTVKPMKEYLQEIYLQIMMAFRHIVFAGFEDKMHTAGCHFGVYREWLQKSGGQGPGKLLDGQACTINDAECIFIASKVIPKSKRSELRVMPETGLSRFQFLEAVVRLAFRRFLTVPVSKAQPETCRGTVQSLVEILHIGEEMVKLRHEVHAALFTEECCLLYKENMDMLRTLYDGYKVVSCYPGRSGKFMSYGAWMELVADSNLVGKDYAFRNVGLAFALGKEIGVDNTSDLKHMELTWGEFLVSLGALVVLCPSYRREFIADDLEELFCDNLAEAQHAVSAKRPCKARGNMKNIDPALQPLITFLCKLFEDADSDNSGTVDFKEFRRVFAQPTYKTEMDAFHIAANELEILFKAFDKDGSGELSLNTLIEGFLKLRQAMKGIDRAISWIKKAFTDADEDGSGSLSKEEFRVLLEHPHALKKLDSLGITGDDIADLFDVVGSGEITVDEIISGFVKMREPQNAGLRGLRILKRLFTEADKDGSGELNKEEVLQAFGSEHVASQLKTSNLRAPDWAPLFEELDVDGSGGLSWEEIEEGMKAFWAKDQFA